MTQENRETMQRAIGIVEGVASVVDDKMADCLFGIAEMLVDVLEKEEKRGERDS